MAQCSGAATSKGRRSVPAMDLGAPRYASNGGVHLAHQTIGDGPVDLLLMLEWVLPWESFGEEPRMARLLAPAQLVRSRHPLRPARRRSVRPDLRGGAPHAGAVGGRRTHRHGGVRIRRSAVRGRQWTSAAWSPRCSRRPIRTAPTASSSSTPSRQRRHPGDPLGGTGGGHRPHPGRHRHEVGPGLPARGGPGSEPATRRPVPRVGAGGPAPRAPARRPPGRSWRWGAAATSARSSPRSGSRPW